MRLEHVLFFDNDNLKENEKEAKAFFKYLYYDLYELFYTKVLYYDENHEGKVKDVLGFSSPITSAPNPEYNSKMDIVWIELETRHNNKAWMNIKDLSIVDLLKVISKKYPKLKTRKIKVA